MQLDQIWNNLAEQCSERIGELVTQKLTAFMHRFCRSEIKLSFSEAEAAKQLGVSQATLAEWRKAGLIAYCCYPQVRSDKLGDKYTYDIADLMNFRARYHIEAANSKNVFEINPRLTLVGAEVRKAA